ncbi:MAG: DUF4149 domain-containing protein [Ottowia sp.]|nr:DUF4149 domain-containing protein [Ottowia sp.]
MRRRIGMFVAALWWGSLVAIGGVAVPLLFATLPSASLAGPVAARLFGAANMLAIGCGVLLLLLFKGRAAGENARAGVQTIIFAAALGVLLALLIQFAVAPRIIAGQNLALWHTLGTIFLVVQWLCAGLILWKMVDPDAARAT